jgi:uncharacterized protein (TIGR02453 family)
MEATRDVFEDSVREPFEAMMDELAGEAELKVFRQHRDLRFSRDKSPYKTRTYGVIFGRAGRYADLSARGLYAGTGYHMLASDQLERFRAGAADDASGPVLADAVAAVEAAGLEVAGASLRTAPRGYPRDHERIELLRRKALFAGRRLAPGAEGIARDVALAHASGAWEAAEPIVEWLDAHVGASTLPPTR